VLSVFWQGSTDGLEETKAMVVLGSLQSDNNTEKSLMNSDIYLTCTPCPVSFKMEKSKRPD